MIGVLTHLFVERPVLKFFRKVTTGQRRRSLDTAV